MSPTASGLRTLHALPLYVAAGSLGPGGEPKLSRTTPTVAMPILARIIAFAEERGADRAKMVGLLGVAPSELADYDVRVPHAIIDRAWRLGAELTGDVAFGLRMARHSPLGEFDLLDFRFANSPTLLDALRQLARYQRLIGDSTAVLRLEIGETEAAVVLEELGVTAYTQPHEMECLLALGLLRARAVTSTAIVPNRVSFRHAAPVDPSQHRALFRAPVTFNAMRHEIVFPVAVLRLATIGSNPRVAAIMDRYADRLMAEMPDLSPDLPVQVRQVIRELLRGTRPELVQVARRLGVSARTLQRALKTEGTEFQRLLEQVQFEMAKRLLAERRHTADEIAFVLGFSDRNSFHRAFRRWSDVTPMAFRRGTAAPNARGD